MRWPGTTQDLVSPSAAAPYSQPFTMSSVVNRTGGTTNFSMVMSAGGGGVPQIIFQNAVNSLGLFDGSLVFATAADNAIHAIQGVFNGASSIIYIDGSSSTVNAGAGVGGNPFHLSGDTLGVATFLAGDTYEYGIWTSAFSGGNLSAMNSNQHTYWGF